ncbi:class I SAM-dependent methyltransferase [Nocardia crassostreae]|uniref:class I SAM-dependent methyltransferase n=1 Tax=Nocardia crassostreae TaxID=53428 RepID=UPI001FE1F41B|nr:class I SAM-dependent methyltransferase [Nocardia crassostreae]
MTSKQQVSRNESDEIGALITWPRRYALLTDLIFLGRAGTVIRRLADASGAGPGDRVLDIGSGPGRLARELARRVGPRGTVLGIDPSGPMVDYAAKGAPANCRFEYGAAQSLTRPDASADVITSTFVMHHIPEAERNNALAGMFRVLRPGGRLLLADASPTSGVHGAVLQFLGKVFVWHKHHHGHNHDHGHAHDDHAQGHHSLADVDVRRYQDALTEIGFTDFEFSTGRYSMGILTAVKPE